MSKDNENKVISMVDYVYHMHHNWSTMFNDKYGEGNPKYDMMGLMCRNMFQYANFLSSPLELGQFVPCVDGKPIEEPDLRNTYREVKMIIADLDNSKKDREQFKEAQERVIFKGLEFDSIDKGGLWVFKYTRCGGYSMARISKYWDVKTLTSQYNVYLTDTKAKALGLT